MNNTELTAFLKDASKAAKKIANPKTPFVLVDLGIGQLYAVRDSLIAYIPKTEAGVTTKHVALARVETELDERGKLQEPAAPEVEPTTDFDVEVARRIAEESIVLEIHIRQPGFTKKIDATDFLERNGNKGKVESDILHVHQDLIDKRHVKKLMDHRQSLLDYIRAWQVPGGMLTPGGGQFLVPIASQDKIYTAIEQFASERQDLLDEFGESWDLIVEEAKKKRGVFFNADDYPSFKSVRERFTHDFRFISNKVPDELKRMSLEIYQKEFNKRMVDCAGAANEIQLALREGFLGLLQHFTDRLGVDEETGKPKRFNEKRITDIRDFLETFQQRNLTGDTELASICEKAQLLLTDVDAATIRSDADTRASLKKAFDGLTEATNELIGVRTRRVRVAGAAA